MKKYIVIYTPDGGRSYDAKIENAGDYTKVYLQFIFAHPRGYMIIAIKEI